MADSDLTDTGKGYMNDIITTVRLDGFDTTKLEGNEFYIINLTADPTADALSGEFAIQKILPSYLVFLQEILVYLSNSHCNMG